MDLWNQAVKVGLFPHHILVLTRVQDLRVWIFFQNNGQGIEQNFHAFFRGKACDHADDRFKFLRAVLFSEGGNSLRRRDRHLNGRQDRGQF